MSSDTFTCRDCKATLPVLHNVGTGYASLEDGAKICYTCCAIRDVDYMTREGKITLYLTVDHESLARAGVSHDHNVKNRVHPRNYGWKLTNWPGSLTIIPKSVAKGSHNMARTRYDVWFTGPDGAQWHGVQLGENSQLCRCRRLKTRN